MIDKDDIEIGQGIKLDSLPPHQSEQAITQSQILLSRQLEAYSIHLWPILKEYSVTLPLSYQTLPTETHVV